MRKYESIIVIRPDLGDVQVKEELQKIEQFLKANGAATVTQNLWGKREIAYYVGTFKQGYYCQVTFETENHGIIELLARQLVITETVIKFQTQKINLPVRKIKAPLRRSQPNEFEFGGDIDYM